MDDHTPRFGSFAAEEQMDGKTSAVEFHWIPLCEVERLMLYPPQLKKLLTVLEQGVQHFVYKEE